MDLPQSRRLRLIWGVVVWTLLATVLRTIRLPNNFAFSQWLLDYRFGFMKRGFVGSVGTLASHLLGMPLSREFIAFCSAVIAGIFYLVLLVVLFRLLQRHALSDRVQLAIFAFISSPFIVMNAHVFGYFDTLLYLLSILILKLIVRGNIYTAAIVQAIAVLCHESYLVIGFPAACLAGFLTCRSLDWSEKRRYLLTQCAPLMTMAVIVLAMATTDEAVLHAQIKAHYLEAGLSVKNSQLFASFQTRGFTENLRRMGPHFLTQCFHPVYWSQIGPAIGCLLYLTYSTFQIRFCSLLSLLLLGAVFAPFIILLVAFDANRICTYSIGSLFFVFWVLSESRFPINSLPLRKGFYLGSFSNPG